MIIAAKIAMIAMTTNNSMRVKPPWVDLDEQDRRQRWLGFTEVNIRLFTDRIWFYLLRNHYSKPGFVFASRNKSIPVFV